MLQKWKAAKQQGPKNPAFPRDTVDPEYSQLWRAPDPDRRRVMRLSGLGLFPACRGRMKA